MSAALLHALRLAASERAIVFAAHPEHLTEVMALWPSDVAPPEWVEIAVPKAGGISWGRLRAQFTLLRGLTRDIRPDTLICLGTTSETLIACRGLAITHAAAKIVAVLHGNLHAATGWRSRDPRHRFLDHHAALTIALHPRIHLITLDEAVREEALGRGLLAADRSGTWPLPISEIEIHDDLASRPGPGAPLRIGFLGSAHQDKGFDDFLALARAFADRPGDYEFVLAGGLMGQYTPADRALVNARDGLLPRPTYLTLLHGLDYVCLPLNVDTYALTVSGAVVDAIAVAKPLTAYPTSVVRRLFRDGPVGVLCSDFPTMRAALANHAELSDPATYREFQTRMLAHRAPCCPPRWRARSPPPWRGSAGHPFRLPAWRGEKYTPRPSGCDVTVRRPAWPTAINYPNAVKARVVQAIRVRTVPTPATTPSNRSPRRTAATPSGVPE